MCRLLTVRRLGGGRNDAGADEFDVAGADEIDAAGADDFDDTPRS